MLFRSVHPNGRYLYGVETLGKRVFRFPIASNGDLGHKEIFGPEDLGHGALPDGFTFDQDGNIWFTEYGAGKIGKIGGNIIEVSHQRLFAASSVQAAELEVMVEARDPAHADAILEALEQAYVVRRI